MYAPQTGAASNAAVKRRATLHRDLTHCSLDLLGVQLYTTGEIGDSLGELQTLDNATCTH